MTEPLFPELVQETAEPRPEPCKWPLFLVAYWPKGGYWAIKEALTCGETRSPTLQHTIHFLQSNGWTHVTIMRLPTTGPWGEE